VSGGGEAERSSRRRVRPLQRTKVLAGGENQGGTAEKLFVPVRGRRALLFAETDARMRYG